MTRAAIIGGGIAGATTAMALQKAGIESTVYEAHPGDATDAGGFLMIMHNGMDALRAIDADHAVVAKSFRTTTVEYFDGAGQLRMARPIGGKLSDVDGPRTLRRASLYRALTAELLARGGHIQYGKRLIDAVTIRTGGVVASFDDGTKAETDLLIGADGIRSTTRAVIDPTAASPRYTGYNNVFGRVRDATLPLAQNSYRMVYGNRAFFGYTTTPSQETYWFARFADNELTKAELASNRPEDWQQRTLRHFVEDDAPSAQIIRATGHEIMGGNGYDQPTTRIWHNGSMVLVGDAAHAAAPAAAQGASLALEDAVVLAKCLRDVPEISEACTIYEQLRRARTERLVAFSASRIEGENPRPTKQPTPEELLTLALAEPADGRAWLYSHRIDWSAPVTLNSATPART